MATHTKTHPKVSVPPKVQLIWVLRRIGAAVVLLIVGFVILRFGPQILAAIVQSDGGEFRIAGFLKEPLFR
jgi:hypothetical protein